MLYTADIHRWTPPKLNRNQPFDHRLYKSLPMVSANILLRGVRNTTNPELQNPFTISSYSNADTFHYPHTQGLALHIKFTLFLAIRIHDFGYSLLQLMLNWLKCIFELVAMSIKCQTIMEHRGILLHFCSRSLSIDGNRDETLFLPQTYKCPPIYPG